ncbi:DUF1841 family protein [Plasticicumulans acidivorans]|uniref:Uncharacterized protein DUF1841 n=1 Tax=Plasticicumulans acidivorans TaxID=886464 RepID=A0A317MYS3_9GAMM|nr:DUF1841 family protein [Plasticicumulans acidivorans]PWV60661.1 uncharacterized protein DUF1841 [Plasticicumulans acidivorans]
MFGTDRGQLRRYYCEVWRRRQAGETLEALEALIAHAIEQHPEYQSLLTDPERAIGGEWTPEMGQTNPFLHMGMHIAIAEQVSSDRPGGLRAAYTALCARIGEVHAAEHAMMEALGEVLWEAQRFGTAPDEARYLARIRDMAGLPAEEGKP